MGSKLVLDKLVGERRQLASQLLSDLDRLLWTMAWDLTNSNAWMLDTEEIHGELILELVKLCANPRYTHLNYTELKGITVRSCRNRIRDLASHVYHTHRRVELGMMSISGADYDSDDEDHNSIDVGANDHVFIESEWVDGLSQDARMLVAEVLRPSERTLFFLDLAAKRKNTVNSNGTWTLTPTPQIMARVMGWTKSRLDLAWDEISSKFS